MSQVPPPPPPAAPPPPPSDAPIGGSSAPFSVGDAVSYGWNAFWKNVGPMILIVLAIWAVNIVLSLIGIAVRATPFVRLFFNLVGWIVACSSRSV